MAGRRPGARPVRAGPARSGAAGCRGRCRRSGHRGGGRRTQPAKACARRSRRRCTRCCRIAIVVHTHSVRTIALAIRADGEARVGRAAGWLALGLGALPQAGPAADPSRGRTAGPRRRRRARPGQSRPGRRWRHGRRGRRRCWPRSSGDWMRRCSRRPKRPPGEAGAALLCASRRTRATHALALDPQPLAWATAGSLYPDHVIFLGPAAADPRRWGRHQRRAGRRQQAVPGTGHGCVSRG